MTASEIEALPTQLKLLGFFKRYTKLLDFHIRLTANSRPESSWTAKEKNKYQYLKEDNDNWWYAISPKEKETIDETLTFFEKLERGEV